MTSPIEIDKKLQSNMATDTLQLEIRDHSLGIFRY